MAGALKLATAAAALAAVGWIAVAGSGSSPVSYQAGAPSPSPSYTAGQPWAFVSGTVDFSEATEDAEGLGYDEGHMWVTTGLGSAGAVLVTDDPRMNGTRTISLNLISESADDSRANLGSALVSIANDEGAWTCPMTFIHFVTDRNADGEIEQWAGWCEGSAAYEGLKAYLAFRQADGGRGQDVYGLIIAGDQPAMPDAPAS